MQLKQSTEVRGVAIPSSPRAAYRPESHLRIDFYSSACCGASLCSESLHRCPRARTTNKHLSNLLRIKISETSLSLSLSEYAYVKRLSKSIFLSKRVCYGDLPLKSTTSVDCRLPFHVALGWVYTKVQSKRTSETERSYWSRATLWTQGVYTRFWVQGMMQ